MGIYVCRLLGCDLEVCKEDVKLLRLHNHVVLVPEVGDLLDALSYLQWVIIEEISSLLL